MKVINTVDENINETLVNIVAKSQEESESIKCVLNSIDKCIVGLCGNNSQRVAFSQILYFESVDKNIFAYVENNIFEISYHLYEIEEIMPFSFLRVSKSVILNLSKVDSFSREFYGRFIANMRNKEKIIISRFYVKDLKEKLKGERM